jgi:hypothetical protein
MKIRALLFFGACGFLILAIIAFYDYQTTGGFGVLGFDNTPDQASKPLPKGDIVATICALFAGILFGVIHTVLTDKKDQNADVKKTLVSIIFSARLCRALVTAPLIFGGVYAATKTQPDKIVALLFAFQNGFFCHAVMKNKTD